MSATPQADPRAYERHWKVRALRGVVRIYAHAWHHLEVRSPCPIPRDGPAILICNHSAGIDPLLLQATCPRVITWMMAREYYELPILRSAFEQLGYIPVSRGARDSASVKAALRTLAAGKVLGIFPEGRIEPSLELMPFQPGVATIAERTRAPVYAAYIAGLQRNISLGQSMVDRQNATITYGSVVRGAGDGAPTVGDLRNAVEMLKRQTLASLPHRHL